MLKIRPVKPTDIPDLKRFTDAYIGTGYYSPTELLEIIECSRERNLIASFLLIDEKEQIQGIRLTLVPGTWYLSPRHGFYVDKWKVPVPSVAYFKSQFVADRYRNQGWGTQLAQASLDVLKQIDCQGVVAHCWKESPGNSSYHYLTKLGFKVLAEHPLFWKDCDYECPRCGRPCQCAALEMFLKLPQEKK